MTRAKSLRPRVIKVINSCETSEQLNSAWNYVVLAGLEQDEITEQAFFLRIEIIGSI